MTFDDVLEQVLALLKRQGRVSYRALKMRFEEIDDEYLDVLREELLFAYPVTEENDRGLVWNRETEAATEPGAQPEQTSQPAVAPSQPVDIKTASIEAPVAGSAERRQLTILFTDLVDSTKLSGQIDAEEYREIVRAYQSTCSKVIEQFGCFIAQTLGDGLLVYSGYPAASERDAENAVRTGLGIVGAMTTLNERLEQEKGIRLAVRIGIHTGHCVIGEIRAGQRQEQLALGEVPNIAARLQGLAAPDTVVMSGDTHRLVEGFFETESLGEHDLKGVAEPVVAYRAHRESGVRSRLEMASARGLTPLVGREREVGLLLERWEQVKDGQGQVVLVSGEGGIGKSRLVEAIKSHVAEGAHTRLECRSSPHFTNSALYPIVEMIQRTLRFQADDAPETKLEKLEENLKQFRSSLVDSMSLFGALLSLPISEARYPSLSLTPQRQRQKTLEAITSWLLELAERQPLLLILEDAHWLDASSQALLDLLIDQAPTSSMLVLVTYRPEFQPSWSNRSYLTPITLNRLSQSQVKQLATQVASGKTLPTEVLEQLTERTDGVPLYVEEMTKSVLESGLLKESDSQYELTGPISSLSIPMTLQDSLMARLDRLVTAKAVAQYASVIGRQFSYELLQAVSELDTSMLQHELHRLVEAELIYQRGLPPDSTYTFKHALIQDIAYESLLRSTRQGYHRRIAAVLEQQMLDIARVPSELLAHHLTEAGLNEQAVIYWAKAGQEAVERSANVEAIEHYKKALVVLNMLPDTPERTEQELVLLIASGAPLMVTQGYGSSEVEHVYTQAHALCQKVEDSPHLFSTLLGLSRVSIFHAEYQRVRELGEQLISYAEQLKEPERFVEAFFTLGSTLLWMGDLENSLGYIQKSHSLYESEKHRSLMLRSGHDHEVGCLTYEARALWCLGYPDQALACAYEALARARDLSHSFSQARALTFVGTLHQYRREVQQTQECTEKLLAISYEHDYAQWISMGMIRRGWALAMQNQVENGIAEIHEGMAAQERMGHRHARIWWLVMLVEAHGVGGRVDDGLRVLAEAFTLIEQFGQRFYEAETHRLKGELLLQQSLDNAAEAESCFHQAISIAQSQHAKSWELRAATSLATLWQQQGKRQNAYHLLAPVYSWFAEGFDTADLIDAKVLLGELS